MGEYEPDDSRDVTLKPNNVPGEPTPTGPREDEAREKAQPTKTQPHQQQQAQSQSMGGMSQSQGGQSQGGEPVASKGDQPHAPGASRVKAETFEEKIVETVDPEPWGAPATPPSAPDPNRESDTGIGDASYDSYADTLSEQAPAGSDARRQQAAEQGDAGDVPAPAETDEDAEAVEEDSDGRGYGDSGQARLDVLSREKS